jgi:hypothetical protein
VDGGGADDVESGCAVVDECGKFCVASVKEREFEGGCKTFIFDIQYSP